MGLDNDKQIYIFKNKLYPILKIGMSKTPQSRLKGIQTSSGFPLELIYESEIIKNAKEAEALIHLSLKEFRTHGEWFNISEEQAITAVEKVTAEAEKGEYRNPIEDYQLTGDCTDLIEWHIQQSEIPIYKGIDKKYHLQEEFIYRDYNHTYYILFNQGKLKRTATFCNLKVARAFKKEFINSIIPLE